MRRSFGGGRGMGGGPGGGGGSMMRAVGRVAARTGVRGSGGGGPQDPFSTTSSNATANSAPNSPRKDGSKVVSKNHFSLSSSSLLGVPLSGTSSWPPSQLDDYFWVSPDGSEDEAGNVYVEKFQLGDVPSGDEVQNAVSALQQVFDSATTPQFISDRFGSDMMVHHVSSNLEPAFHLHNSTSLSPYGDGLERALDAFQLLKTDSSVQKMVVSLSQDKAVWDAILNNDVVRDLRESCYGGVSDDEDTDDENSIQETTPLVNVVMQMFGQTKAKFMDMIEKITNLVKHLFNLHKPTSTTAAAGHEDLFESKLRVSFMLTIVVLLTVVLNRARRA